MGFDRDWDPYADRDRRRELEDWDDVREGRVELFARHAPVSFRCVNCGQQPTVPWCQLCGGQVAA